MKSFMLAPALFLATGLLVVGADGSALGQRQKDKEKEKIKEKLKGKGKKEGAAKGAKDLRRAFDGITDLTQLPPAGKEATRVLDHAKRFYREAVRQYQVEPRPSAELAVAAKDAVRGLEHMRRAAARPVPGLPEPPTENVPPFGGPKRKGPPPADAREDAERGPWSEALNALTEARERLTDVESGSAINGLARDFLDSAKAVYRQARTAYESGDYRRSAELARAAEAWAHVPEHLERAGWEGIRTPGLAPPPKAKGSGAPPPPPLLKE